MRVDHSGARLAYYITPHGFGHAVRSLEVVRQLLSVDPGLDIIIVSDIPEFLVEQNVGRSVPFRRKRLDVGLAQEDSIRFDLDATLEAVQGLFHRREALITEEIRFLEGHRVDGIVSDIAFLPFFAASRHGIPALGLGNFTWDWIYEAYAASDPRWMPLIAWIREGYGQCGLLLQLPMHGDCSACPRIQDVPLVARRSARSPEETRRILGCKPGERAFLIAFAALDLDEKAQERIEAIPGTVFYFKRPLHYRLRNGRALDPLQELSYADVVAAMDGVITKPGYGIVSDCLAHGTPLIYTDRGPFPEYEILVEAIERDLTCVYMPSEDLYSGCWGPAVERLSRLPRTIPRMRSDGAAVCAGIIRSHFK